MKKNYFIVLAMVMLLIVGNGRALAVTFDNDSTDGKWETPINWSGDAVPSSGQTVNIVYDKACVIDGITGTVSHTARLYLGYDGITEGSGGGTLTIDTGGIYTNTYYHSSRAEINFGGYNGDFGGVLNINGGTVNLNNVTGIKTFGTGHEINITNGGILNVIDTATSHGYIYMGSSTDGSSTITIDNGTINAVTGGDGGIYLGNSSSSGTHNMNMTSGTIKVDYLYIARKSGTTSHFQFDGGTVNVLCDSNAAFSFGSGTGSMDMRGDAAFILAGDRRSVINGYIDAGKITSYGGNSDLSVIYADSNTTVTAAAPTGLLDDFEDYSSSKLITSIWTGNIELSTAIKHAGRKAMKSGNDNNTAPYYTEVGVDPNNLLYASRDFSSLKYLRLYYRGEPNNINQEFYIKLTDESSNTGKVICPDANALTRSTWNSWYISMSDPNFASMDKAHIVKVTLGTGNGAASGQTAIQWMYVDDIFGFTEQICRPNNYPLAGDLNKDCVVDFNDARILAAYWLEAAYDVAAVAPDDVNHLRVRYTFDDGSGSTVADSSGHGFNATIVNIGSGQWDAAGKYNGCLEFATDAIPATVGTEVDGPEQVFDTLDKEITFSMWADVNFSDLDPALSNMVTYAPDYSTEAYVLGIKSGNHTLGSTIFRCGYDVNTTPAYESTVSYSTAANDPNFVGWHHYAFTKNVAAGTECVYRDGVLMAANTDANKPITHLRDSIAYFNIGYYNKGTSKGAWFIGRMDEYRVYDYELSQAEIVYLAGLSSVHQPLLPDRRSVDEALINDEKINFSDFAKMAENWMEQLLWP